MNFVQKIITKNSIQIDQTVFWKIRKSKTVTLLFIWPFRPDPAISLRGPAKMAHGLFTRARARELGPATRGPAALACSPGPAACVPAARSNAPPRPGRNLGLGREFSLAPFPAWAAALAQLISAARADRTVGLQCRWIKTSERRRSLNPSPFLCLLSPLLSHGDASEDEGSAQPPRHRRRREDDTGAKPLAGARARPWQSAPPSSGFGPLS